MFNSKLTLAASLVAALTLSGCDSKDEVEVVDRSVGANLSVTNLDANTLNFYEMGDTIAVDYQLDVNELSSPDVVIDFYLVHTLSGQGEDESEIDIDETQLLATETHLAVSNGSHIHSFSAEIPSVDHTGNYWIVPVVDPENEVVEVHEDDNYPNINNEQHVEGDIPAVLIDIEQSPQHEFEFVQAYLDGGLVVLDSPEVHADTGEHHSDIVGHIDAIYHEPNDHAGCEASEDEAEGCDNGVTADLTAEVMIDGVYTQVQLWDASVANDDGSTGDYVDSQSIEFEYNGDEHFFGYDIALTDAQLDTLYQAYDADAAVNEISVRLTLTDTTAYGPEHDDANNTIELTVPLYFFEQEEIDYDEEVVAASKAGYKSAKGISFSGNKLQIDGSYDKSYGDASKFKVGLDLGGEMKVDLLDKAASLEAGGSLDMWIFNAHNVIFSANFDGQAYVAGVNTGYDAEMVIFNATVYENSRWVAQFEKTFEKSWEEERTLVRARFSIGPVPLTVRAGVDGNVGFELTIGYALSELYAEGDLFNVGFGGFANGGIDLALVEAGVTIDLNIVENVLSLESSAELDLLNSDVNPRINYAFALTDDIDVISGKAGLYAKVTSIKWKKKWGIPYPAGKKTKTYYLWFYQTPSVYKKSWTIFSKEGSRSLI
ncbi:MAG: hypothetical protein HWE10_01115 [Gammaproteobacteria bacterium]|nr:hypothetical protein [Gammaproteobacteria bacterium]